MATEDRTQAGPADESRSPGEFRLLSASDKFWLAVCLCANLFLILLAIAGHEPWMLIAVAGNTYVLMPRLKELRRERRIRSGKLPLPPPRTEKEIEQAEREQRERVERNRSFTIACVAALILGGLGAAVAYPSDQIWLGHLLFFGGPLGACVGFTLWERARRKRSELEQTYSQ